MMQRLLIMISYPYELIRESLNVHVYRLKILSS